MTRFGTSLTLNKLSRLSSVLMPPGKPRLEAVNCHAHRYSQNCSVNNGHTKGTRLPAISRRARVRIRHARDPSAKRNADSLYFALIIMAVAGILFEAGGTEDEAIAGIRLCARVAFRK
jgi:hypothetical protein